MPKMKLPKFGMRVGKPDFEMKGPEFDGVSMDEPNVDVPKLDVNADLPDLPSIEGGVGVEGKLPEGDLKSKAPDVDVDLDTVLSGGGRGSFDMKMPEFKMLKFGIKGNEKFGIDINAPDLDIGGPDFDVSVDSRKPDIAKLDVDVNAELPKVPSIEGDLDVPLKGPDADLDVKLPSKGRGNLALKTSGLRMPKFGMKFGKLDVDDDAPQIDIEGPKLKGEFNVDTPELPSLDLVANTSDLCDRNSKFEIDVCSHRLDPKLDLGADGFDMNIPKFSLNTSRTENTECGLREDSLALPNVDSPFDVGTYQLPSTKEFTDLDLERSKYGVSGGIDLAVETSGFDSELRPSGRVIEELPKYTMDTVVSGSNLKDSPNENFCISSRKDAFTKVTSGHGTDLDISVSCGSKLDNSGVQILSDSNRLLGRSYEKAVLSDGTVKINPVKSSISDTQTVELSSISGGIDLNGSSSTGTAYSQEFPELTSSRNESCVPDASVKSTESSSINFQSPSGLEKTSVLCVGSDHQIRTSRVGQIPEQYSTNYTVVCPHLNSLTVDSEGPRVFSDVKNIYLDIGHLSPIAGGIDLTSEIPDHPHKIHGSQSNFSESSRIKFSSPFTRKGKYEVSSSSRDDASTPVLRKYVERSVSSEYVDPGKSTKLAEVRIPTSKVPHSTEKHNVDYSSKSQPHGAIRIKSSDSPTSMIPTLGGRPKGTIISEEKERFTSESSPPKMSSVAVTSEPSLTENSRTTSSIPVRVKPDTSEVHLMCKTESKSSQRELRGEFTDESSKVVGPHSKIVHKASMIPTIDGSKVTVRRTRMTKLDSNRTDLTDPDATASYYRDDSDEVVSVKKIVRVKKIRITESSEGRKESTEYVTTSGDMDDDDVMKLLEGQGPNVTSRITTRTIKYTPQTEGAVNYEFDPSDGEVLQESHQVIRGPLNLADLLKDDSKFASGDPSVTTEFVTERRFCTEQIEEDADVKERSPSK